MQEELRHALEEAQGRAQALEEEVRCAGLDAKQLEATMRGMHTSLQVINGRKCRPACMSCVL